MNQTGKWLLIIGAGIMILGLIIGFLPARFMPGRLPGDIMIRRGNSTFYFPIVTCLLLSLLISLIMYIIRQLK